MPDNVYKQREQAGPMQDPGEDSAGDTMVLERDWNAVAYGRPISAAEPQLTGALRHVHASLYTLRAYKRWMLKIRETWNIDQR